MQTEQGQERRPGVISRVVTWLRAGYPEGIPTGDYVALLGVLRRRLREEEIEEIVERLAAQRELGLTRERLRELIREYSLQDPHEGDVERVTALLSSTGYPVEGEGHAPAGAEEDAPAAAEEDAPAAGQGGAEQTGEELGEGDEQP